MEHILAKGRKSREKLVRAGWHHSGVLSLLALAACGGTSDGGTVSITLNSDSESPNGRKNVVSDQLFVEGATVNSTYFIDLSNLSYAGEDPRFTVIISPTLYEPLAQTILDIDYDSETQLLSFRGTSDLATHEDVITTVSIGVSSVIRTPNAANITESYTETIEITLAAIDDDPLVNLENQFILNDDFSSTTFSLKALREGDQGLFDEEGDAYSVAFTASELPTGYSLLLTTITLDQREYESLEVVTDAGAPALVSGDFVVTVTYSEYELEGAQTSELNRIIDPFEVVYTIAFAGAEGTPASMQANAAPVVSVVVMNADGTQTPQIGSSFPTMVEEITLMEGEESPADFVTLIDTEALFTSGDGDALIYGFDYTLDDSVSGISVEWAGEETTLQHQLTISGMPTFVDDNDVYLTISAYAYDTSFVTVSHTFTIALQNTLEAPDQIDTLQDITIFEESTDPYTFDMSRIFQKQSAANNPDTYVSYSVDASVGSSRLEERIELKASTDEFSVGEQLAASLTFQDDLAVLRAPNLIAGNMPLVIYYTIHGFGAEDTPSGDTKTSRATSVLLTVTVSNVEEDFRMLSETFSTEFDPAALTVVPLADRVRETNNLDLSLAGTYALNYIDGTDTVTETVTVSSQVVESADPNDPSVLLTETIYTPLVVDEEREFATSLTIDAAGSFVFEDDTVGVASNITYRIDLAQHDVYSADNVRMHQTDALDVWQQTIGNQLADWWVADLSLSIDVDTGVLTVGGQPQIFGSSDDSATITVGIIAEKEGVTLTDSFLLAVANTNDAPQVVPEIGATVPVGDSAIPTLTLTDNNALSGSGEAIFLTTLFEDLDGDALIYAGLSVDASTGETSIVDTLTLLETTGTFDLNDADGDKVGMVSGLEVTVSKLGVITVKGEPILQHLLTTGQTGLITETVMDSNGDPVVTIFASMQFDINVQSWFQDTPITALVANSNSDSYTIDMTSENLGEIRQSFELRILPHASDPAYYAINPEMTQITKSISGSVTTSATIATSDPVGSELGTTYTYTLQDSTQYLDDFFYTWNLNALIGDPDFVSQSVSDLSFEIIDDFSAPVSSLQQNGTVEMTNTLTASDDSLVMVDFSIAPHTLSLSDVLGSVNVTTANVGEYQAYELVWTVQHRELSDLDVNLLKVGDDEILEVSGNDAQRQITGEVPYIINLRGTDSNGGEEDFRIVLLFDDLADGGNEAVRTRKDEISYSVVGLKDGVRTTIGDRQTIENDTDTSRKFTDLTFTDQESQNLQWNLNDFFIDSEGDAITYSLATGSSGQLTGMSANIEKTGSSYFLNVIGTPSIVQNFDPAVSSTSTLVDGVFAVTVTASNTQESLSVTTTVSIVETFSITFENVDSPIQFKDDETPTITVVEDSTAVVQADFIIVDPDTITPFGQGVALTFNYDTNQFFLDIAYEASGVITIKDPDVLQASSGVAAITASVYDDDGISSNNPDPLLGVLTFTVTIDQVNDVVSQTLTFDSSYVEDRLLDTQQIDLLEYVQDVEAEAISFSLRNTNDNYFLSNGITYELNGTMLTISGTPDIPEAEGTANVTESFLLDMSDGTDSSLFSLTHTITQANDAPRARFVEVEDGTVLQYLALGGFSLTESDTPLVGAAYAFDFKLANVLPFVDPEGTALSFTTGNLTLSGNTDYLDANDLFRVSLSSTTNILTVAGTPNLIGTGDDVTIYFDMVVTDSVFAGLPVNSTTLRLAVPIVNVNDSPEAAAATLPDITIAEEESLVTVIEMDTFVTDDDADVLAFQASVIEGGLSIDLTTSTIDVVTWTHVDDWGISFYFDEFDQLNIDGAVQLPEPASAFAPGDSLTLTLGVTATDPDAESVAVDFQIFIANTNDAPVLQSPVGVLILTEDLNIAGHEIELDIEDLDGDAFTVVEVEPIDAGFGINFTFANNTITLAGDPNIPAILHSNGSVFGNTSDSTITVTYVGYDFVGGATVTDYITITITNENDSPEVLQTLGTITLAEDTFVPSSYQLRTLIGDAEGDGISFAASVSSALTGVTVEIVNGDTLSVTATPDITTGGHANLTTTMEVTAWDSDLGTDPTTITELLTYTIDVVVTNIDDKPEITNIPSSVTVTIDSQLATPWDVKVYSNASPAGNLLVDQEGDAIYLANYTITSDDLARFPGGVLPQFNFIAPTNKDLSIEFPAWAAGEFLTPGDATLLLSLDAADALDTDNNGLDPDRTSSLVITLTFDNPNQYAPVHVSEQILQIAEGIALDQTWDIDFTDGDGDTVSTVGVEYNGSALSGAIFSVGGSDSRITLSDDGVNLPQLAAGNIAPLVTDTLTVTASDGVGGFVTTSFVFTIENRDDAPVAYTEFETVSFVEDSAADAYRLTLANYIRDPELHATRFGLDSTGTSAMSVTGLQSTSSEDDFSFSVSITDDGVLVLDGTPDFDGNSATHSLTLDIVAFSSILANNASEVSLAVALSTTFTLSIEVEQTNDAPYFNVLVLEEAAQPESIVQTFTFDEVMGWDALTSETYTLDHMFIDTEQAPVGFYSFPDLTIASNVLYDPLALSLVSFTVDILAVTSTLGAQSLSGLSFPSAPVLRGHEDGTLTLSISASDGVDGQVVQLVTLVLENPNETAAAVTAFSLDGATPNIATIVEDAALPGLLRFTFADPDANGTMLTSISITDVSITSGFNIAAQVAASTDNLIQTISFTAIDPDHAAATIGAGFSHLDANPELTITYIDPIGTVVDVPTATYTHTLTLTIENIDNPVVLADATRHTFDNSTEGQASSQQFLISDLFFDREGDSITYSLSISSDEQGDSIALGYGLTMAIVQTTNGDMITISGTPEIVGLGTVDATIAVDLRGWSDNTTVDFPLFLTIENENDPVLSIADLPIVTLNEGQGIGGSGTIALASLVSDDDNNSITVIASELVANSDISGLSVSYITTSMDEFVLAGTPELLGTEDATQTLRVTFNDGAGAANSQAVLDFIINITNVDDVAVSVGTLPVLLITQDVGVSDGTNPYIRVDLNDYFQDPEGLYDFGVSDVSWTLNKIIDPLNPIEYTLTTANNGLQLDSTNASSSGLFTLSGIPHLAISTTEAKLGQLDGNFTTNISGEIDVSVTGATPAGEAGNTVTSKAVINLTIDAAPVTVTDTHDDWNAATTLFDVDGGLHRMTIDMNDYFADTDATPESLTFTVNSTGASAMRLSAFDAEIEEDGQFVGYVYGVTTFTVIAEDSFHAATATFVMENFGEDLSTLPSSSASVDADNGRAIEGFRINGDTNDSRFGSAVASGTYTESGTTKQLYLIGAPHTKQIDAPSSVSGDNRYGGEVYLVLDDFIASADNYTTNADGVREYDITDLKYSQTDPSKRFGLIIRGEDAPQADGFGENLGSVLANIGDFNGDNIDDYAIGGRQYVDDSMNRPVYILYGRDEWVGVGTASLNNYRVIDTSLWDTDSDLGEKFEITTQAGTRSDIALGERFAYGDLNNDGLTDLIIGAPSFGSDNTGVESSGAAVVVYGKANGLTGNVHDLGASTNSDKVLWIEGATKLVSSGELIALGYDIATTQFNNDSFDDLVLTRHGEDEVIIVYGDSALGSVASDGRQVLNIDDSALDSTQTTVFEINKDDASDTRELKSVAFGDFDGDGFSDLAIGVGRTLKVADTNPGYLYLVYGHDGTSFNYGNTGANTAYDLDDLVTSGDADQFSFLTAGEGFGFDMDSGDLNGDGIDDLLIGVPNGTNAQGEYGAGGSLLFFGANKSMSDDYSYAMQWNDAADGSYSDFAADTARSVDVDGSTAIVGAAYDGELDTGAAYVFEWDG